MVDIFVDVYLKYMLINFFIMVFLEIFDLYKRCLDLENFYEESIFYLIYGFGIYFF